jgi:hypothetical protein
MINKRITLNDIEQDTCRNIATQRFNNNRKECVNNAKIGKQSNNFTDLEGIGSEFAFCKLFNVFPDLSIEIRSSQKEEDNGDAILHNGAKVDVKSTKYKNGKLLAVPWKKPDVEFFALMIGQFPSYVFKGFMKQEELCQPNRLGSLGYGETYIAQQQELKELEDLLPVGVDK